MKKKEEQICCANGIKELVKENERLEAEVKETQERKLFFYKENKRLLEVNKELAEQNAKLANERDELETELEKAKQSRSEYINKLADKTTECERLRGRLNHLLGSDFIASFDKVNTSSNLYVRDIAEADKIRNEWFSFKVKGVSQKINEQSTKATFTIGKVPKAMSATTACCEEKSSVTPLPRKCWVDDGNYYVNGCLFHRWVDRENIVITFKDTAKMHDVEYVTQAFNTDNIIINRNDCVAKSCKVTNLYGLVEYPDGKMDFVEPDKIQFVKEGV